VAITGDDAFATPKPERLIHRILHIATNPGDLVLDSFAGSGTTGAVAHKMGRRWIMVELGEHCDTHIVPRLRKVIDGADPGGVTEATGWKGGGGFRYCTLAPSLLEKDDRGNPIISKEYNAAMLAEAICVHEGFAYEPSRELYWLHGVRRDSPDTFLWVTTQTLTRDRLERLSTEIGEGRHLMVSCLAFKGDPGGFPNLVVKKLPTSILDRCEWGKDDYSLKIAALGASPAPEPEAEGDAAAPTPAAGPKKRGKKAKGAEPEGQGDLFGAANTKKGG
jgi:adenine-specific DNA-methyltransferase